MRQGTILELTHEIGVVGFLSYEKNTRETFAQIKRVSRGKSLSVRVAYKEEL